MAYTPHTPADIRDMLEVVGAASVSDLFADLPDDLRYDGQLSIPDGVTELELVAMAERHAARNVHAGAELSFLGYGAYDHYVPPAVDALISRSEFATAYTPYQPEVSQGTLQSIFEFQTAISELTGLPVANASLYDGATATAEAMYLAQQVGGGSRAVVLDTVLPEVREVLATYAWAYDMELVTVASGPAGTVDPAAVAAALDGETACLIVQTPNVFGLLEDAPTMCAAANDAGVVPVVHADPLSLGVLEAPGEYGAGVVVGSGQPLGNGLNFGGPTFGFFAADRRFVRRMPGRIVGQSRDARGARAYTLTLQTREQHIRREKATSNICTNQALCALAGTAYLAWLGPQGHAELAAGLFDRAAYLAERLGAIDGVDVVHDGPWFREVAVTTPLRATEFVQRLRERGINPGVPLGDDFASLGPNALLVAVTERHGRAEIDALAGAVAEVLS